MDASQIIGHLRTQFRHARPILFAGAGFSRSAYCVRGTAVPLGQGLSKLLWELALPGEEFDPAASLQDVYHVAARTKAPAVATILRQHFSVDGKRLPDFYRHWLAPPWFRIYTLNIDNLISEASRHFALDRTPISVSGVSTDGSQPTVDVNDPSVIEVMHLHGTLADVPDRITFSRLQYAQRLTNQDPVYARLATDIVSHPVVFVGATLEEPVLWQHIELRRVRGSELPELRPKSYLVDPTLNAAKRLLLREFNVTWVPLTAEEFAEQVLKEAADAFPDGIKAIARRARRPGRGVAASLPDAASLIATSQQEKTAYLLGQEPVWSDITLGRAITRSFDADLDAVIDTEFVSRPRPVVVLTGTAGAGKSTSLMRQIARQVARGHRVAFLDRDSELSAREIVVAMAKKPAFDVLAIDDAASLGGSLATLVVDVSKVSDALIVLAIRSGSLERFLNPELLGGLRVAEEVMPALDDTDISALVVLLDRENLLGVLKGRTRTAQEAAFREHAGRQLLVAMYEATSGRKFEEKIADEYRDLRGVARTAYALISVADHLGFSLERDDLLIATGDFSNEAMNAIQMLSQRQLVSATPGGALRARHKVLAGVLVDHLAEQGELIGHLKRLAFVAATRVTAALPRGAKPWRMLKRILNHDFLMRTAAVDECRELYDSMEQLLSWDYHYWLQRGSLEVEQGVLALAENFIGQAFGLAPTDPMVLTERAYLQLRKAIESPRASDSGAQVDEAIEALNARIASDGSRDHYPYHVLGAQGLAWVRRGPLKKSEKKTLLQHLVTQVGEGVKRHRSRDELRKLLEDLKREQLALAIVPED